MPLLRIVSGAQTGVDQGALDAALTVGFPCGGWCPGNRNDEDGEIPSRFPVTPLPDGGYRARTVQNVVDRDGTLIVYFGQLSGGTEQTALHCNRRHKPVFPIDAQALPVDQAAKAVAEFVRLHNIQALNVAGPRQSREPRGYAYAHDLVAALIQGFMQTTPEVVQV